MTSAPTATTTTLDTIPPLVAQFLPVGIGSMSEAQATLRDGSIIVKVSATAEIAYTVRRLHDDRTGSDVLFVREVAGASPWRQLDPVWQLPAVLVYTPQS